MNDYTPPGSKVCKTCRRELPATREFFDRGPQNVDGLRGSCKECRRARMRNWCNSNPDKVRAYQKKYQAEHIEELRAYRKEYAKNHRQAHRDAARKWRQKYPLKAQIKGIRRRARKKGASGTHTHEQVVRLLSSQKNKCWWCGKVLNGKYHVDHRVPLSKGGSNDIANIVIACPDCNWRKHDKMPSDYCGRLL